MISEQVLTRFGSHFSGCLLNEGSRGIKVSITNSSRTHLYPLYPPWHVHCAVWTSFTVCVVLLLILESSQRGQNFWNGFQEAQEYRKRSYAETVVVENLFRTSANTWSNLAYAVVGFYAMGFAAVDAMRPALRAGDLQSTPAMSLLFGIACCFLAAASGLFHASLTRRGQQLDVTAMYTPLLVIIAVAFGRMWPWWRFPGMGTMPAWPCLVGLVILTTFLFYIYKWSLSSAMVLALLIVIVAGLALRELLRCPTRLGLCCLLTAIVSLGTAVGCRELDIQRRFSTSDAVFQGHAVWHVLTAIALAAIYVWSRSCDRMLSSEEVS